MYFTGTNSSPLEYDAVKKNLIKRTCCDETKKMAHDSQIGRAEESLKLSQGGPSQRQTSGTNQPIIAYYQGRH